MNEMNITNAKYIELEPGINGCIVVEIDGETCEVDIYYDNNRRAGRSWTIPLETNKFLIFPSSLKYQIRNVNNKYLNFVQTILFEYPAADGGGYNGQ